ncbi:MAG TPA: DUF2007 domain-containing protein [Nevskia sp.]|nr:DUF2007 domain-containing protein [Nevskia sp.]
MMGAEGFEDLAGMGRLVLLARVLEPVQAHILQGRLQAEGIPVFVADGQLVQTNPLWTFALGGVRVLVPEHLLERARAVMAALEEGRYALDEDAAPDTTG